MRTFIAYRFTGESLAELKPMLEGIVEAFSKRGVEAYCSLFDEPDFQEKGYTQRQIFDYTFSVLDDTDFIFVLQMSKAKSEGMLMEIGYCIAKKKPVVLAQKRGITETYIHEFADTVVQFNTIDDVLQEIQSLTLPKNYEH